MQTDEEVARAARLKPIADVAAGLGIPEQALTTYGSHKAKVDTLAAVSPDNPKQGRLILVTAMTPTTRGEGKTTVAIGLGDGLMRLGHKAVVCLRQPSLGPNFGLKGGATGSGRAQVAPRDDINLHFTGDFHAVASANNLLAAVVDDHLFRGRSPRLDPRRITWRRTVDMNDRALREIVVGLGGVGNGIPRQDRFDIVPDSEVMAVLCLARDQADLETRLARMVVGYTRDREPVFARDLNAHGAMSVLLRDALAPNLVQTLEHTPVLMHGGTFANYSHGCNSVIATRTALALGRFVVTEAGFGADLGAQKFFDIKCRQADLHPSLVVIVATVGSLKAHAGVAPSALAEENVEAVKQGIPNLLRHMEIVRTYGLPMVVAINRFAQDSTAEQDAVRDAVEASGAVAIVSDHWREGGKGAQTLAAHVAELADSPYEGGFRLLYPDDTPLVDKVETVATRIYGASGVVMDPNVRARFDQLQADGYGHLPVCMSKTHLSLSADSRLKGAPVDFTVPITDVRLAAGAGFVVAMAGESTTMPGLPKHAVYPGIHLDHQGQIEGIR
jgi:formate--tetrahydrofolate ligase